MRFSKGTGMISTNAQEQQKPQQVAPLSSTCIVALIAGFAQLFFAFLYAVLMPSIAIRFCSLRHEIRLLAE